MKKWAKLSFAGIGVVSVGIGLSLWLGIASWNNKTARLIKKLYKSAQAVESKTVSFQGFDALPPPVARYFRLVLKEGQTIIRTARIKHTGEFWLNNKWIPFESTQHFSAHPPAFIWDADMKMNPLMNVRVRDSYVSGKSWLQAKILSLITVMDAHGDPQLDEGELQRYLAESVWLPTALLPSKNLQWTAATDQKAMATLTDGKITVSLEFEFNGAGEITGIFSPARFKEVDGIYEPFPWTGRFWNYEERGEMWIPLQGEVEWQMPEGPVPYWRGLITAVEYDYAQ